MHDVSASIPTELEDCTRLRSPFVKLDRSGLRARLLRRSKHHRRWSHRLVISFNVLVIAVSLVTGAGLLYLRSKDQIRRIHLDNLATDAGVLPDGETAATFPDGSKVTAQNWLITGTDDRSCVSPGTPGFFGPGDTGRRSDTIMVLRLDPDRGTSAILSFPRDLVVQVDEHDAKLNSAYDGQNPQKLINVLGQRFQIKIDHYIGVSFCAFDKVVDALNGVKINFAYDIRDTNTGFSESAGCSTLSGADALKYVRSREFEVGRPDASGTINWSKDPTADLGRIQRQQQFVKILAQRAVNHGVRSPSTYNRLIDAVGKNIKTDDNLTNGDLGKLASRMLKLDPAATAAYMIQSTPTSLGKESAQRISTDGPGKVYNDAVLTLFGAPIPAARAPSPDASTVTVPTTQAPRAGNVPSADPSCG
jgi:LCP family protein required for cell wall assembly